MFDKINGFISGFYTLSSISKAKKHIHIYLPKEYHASCQAPCLVSAFSRQVIIPHGIIINNIKEHIGLPTWC